MIAELRIADDHAAFAGHFPGFPLLPGAVLLDEVLLEIVRMRSLDPTRWRGVTVKFLAIVRPGDVLTLEHAVANETTIRFAVRNAQDAVASGTLSAIGAGQRDADGG